MSYNETIYSGTSAHSARQIADELHGREWPLADSNFRDLAGAVTTLAREVAQQRTEIAKQAASLVAVAREVERIRPVVVDHDSGPRVMPLNENAPLPPYPAPADQLAMVYEGLREVRSMIAAGWQQTEQIEDALTRSLSRGGLLQAIDMRLAAMLEAGEPREG